MTIKLKFISDMQIFNCNLFTTEYHVIKFIYRSWLYFNDIRVEHIQIYTRCP